MRSGILAGKIIPVMCGAATLNYGTQPLLDAIVNNLPSPAAAGSIKATKGDGGGETEIKADDPVSAFVFKTFADPFVGKISYFKVYSGHSGDSHCITLIKAKTSVLARSLPCSVKPDQPGQSTCRRYCRRSQTAAYVTGDTLVITPPAYLSAH